MTAVYIAAAVIILLAVILSVPVGAAAEYSDGGFTLFLKIGFIKADILKLIKKLREKPKKPEKPKAEQKTEAPKKGGTVKKLRAVLPDILDFLGSLRKKLTVNELTLYYTSASKDAADAAVNFGRAYAAMGAFAAVLENVFNVKKRDFRASVSFDETEPRVYLKADAALRTGQLLFISARLGLRLLKLRKVK